MNNLILNLKKFKELYISGSFFVSTIITIFIGYTNIITSIKNNTIRSEIIQITMLKSIVREFERNTKCEVSDAEWDEHLLNYSTLFDLKQKHNLLSKKAQWLPIERSFEKCKK